MQIKNNRDKIRHVDINETVQDVINKKTLLSTLYVLGTRIDAQFIKFPTSCPLKIKPLSVVFEHRNVFREVTDLPEVAQQESGRVGFRLYPSNSVDMEDDAWSRMPFLTNFLQVIPSGPALPQAMDPRTPCYLLGETHQSCYQTLIFYMISSSLSNCPYKSALVCPLELFSDCVLLLEMV